MSSSSPDEIAFRERVAKTCRCGRRGEWPGRLCPACKENPAGPFDPVSLRTLAEHLRDGTWLDMEVCDTSGPSSVSIVTLERVKIVEVIVRTSGEDLVLSQQWVTESDKRVDDRLVFDAEAIRRCKSTSVSLLDVRPHRKPVVVVAPHDPSAQVATAHVCVAEGALLFGEEFDHLKGHRGGRGAWNLVHARHKVIIAIYETTDLSPERICKDVFGYKSAGPFLLAAGKARRDAVFAPRGSEEYKLTEAFRADVAVLGVRVALRRGVTRRKDIIRDYDPCLSRP